MRDGEREREGEIWKMGRDGERKGEKWRERD